jgi:hypothetical protein
MPLRQFADVAAPLPELEGDPRISLVWPAPGAAIGRSRRQEYGEPPRGLFALG